MSFETDVLLKFEARLAMSKVNYHDNSKHSGLGRGFFKLRHSSHTQNSLKQRHFSSFKIQKHIGLVCTKINRQSVERG